MEQQGTPVIHLETGSPDFDTPKHIKQAACCVLEEVKVHYMSNYGILPLRQAIAKKMRSFNLLDYDPELRLYRGI